MTTLAGDDVKDRVEGFAAGGTLPRAPDVARPSEARRLRLLVEFGLLFIGTPLAMHIAVADYHVPLFYALPPLLLAFIAFLLFDPSFSVRQEVRRGVSRATLVSILAIFIIGSVVVAAFVADVMPGRLFSLAAERPGMWLGIMTLYPFLSVLPQEFIYRVFFFHRYGPLFHSRFTLILTNGLVFGFGHILFRNWIAVGGSFALGLLFAWRYERTRSFWAVYLEHLLWGWLVFTIGLGVFFFTGVNNPAW
ncbi:MAG TPA: CPBP family intramembrane glutamic endopeptidase [Hyphomicrobium sp.]